MSAHTKDKGKFIVVKWDSGGRNLDEKMLNTFIKAKCKEEPVITMGKKDGCALLTFKGERSGKFLKEQLKDDSFWTLASVTVVPETHKVKVTNLPKDATMESVLKFLTNKNNMNRLSFSHKILHLDNGYFHPLQGYCVVELKSENDVRKVCENSGKFKLFEEQSLSFEPYYEDIDPVEDDEACLQVDPVSIEVDKTKLEYVKEFFKKSYIQDKLTPLCGKLVKDDIDLLIDFACAHDGKKVQHSRKWQEEVRKVVDGIFKEIVIVSKTVSEDVWSQVQRNLIQNASDKVWVKEEAVQFRVTLVGKENSQELDKLEKAIDSIQPPKPKDTKDIECHDPSKVSAFRALRLHQSVDGYEVTYDEKASVIRIFGDIDKLRDTEKKVLTLLGKIVIETAPLPSASHAKILSSSAVQRQIEKIQNNMGERCGHRVYDAKLNLFSVDATVLERLKSEILDLVRDETIEIGGEKPRENDIEEVVRDVRKKLGETFYFEVLNCSDTLKIRVICEAKDFSKANAMLTEDLEKIMTRQEKIKLPKFLFKVINSRYKELLENEIKKAGLPFNSISFSENTILVDGNKEVRPKVKDIVQKEARKIKIWWQEIEGDGVHNYFDSGEGEKFLKRLRENSKCDFKFVTWKEMKTADIHCIVILNTGQAIFVGKGSLTNLKFPTDVVVNAANAELDHKGGLAKQIADCGGSAIQEECRQFIRQSGKLSPGQVFSGLPGTMPCERIFHAYGPEWRGGGNGEDDFLRKVMENILDKMTKEPDYILQSLAMPLISAGVFGFPTRRAADILLATLEKKYQNLPQIREVYFLDYNPETARTIQKAMQAVFKEKCFHLPVQDVALGQGVMGKGEKPGKDFVHQRSGSRTLRLAGKRKMIIQWGELPKASAEVMVNVTADAPRPSGKISDALKQAAGISYDMDGKCEKAFRRIYQQGPVPDGALVTTDAGRIPVAKKIFHLKIPPQWDKHSGRNTLSQSIMKCLDEANRLGMTTIAFPTIGTVDCKFPGTEVATEFIRTVSKFVSNQTAGSCSLKEIIIVIYKTDEKVTREFEDTIQKVYSMRPHRLEADIEDTVKEEGEETGATGEGKKKEERKPEQYGQQADLGRSHLSIYTKQGAKSPLEGSFCVNSTASAVVELQIGNIENSTADAIVCTTSSFPILNGAIPNAIKRVGGYRLQEECTTKYKVYPKDGVAVTGPGKLSCKNVYYVKLENYNGTNEQDIYNSVTRCLVEAERDKMTSIALPTFGTGGFRYPDNVAASNMFEAVADFFKTSRNHPTEILVVMFGAAKTTCQVFNQEAQNRFTQMKTPDLPNVGGKDLKQPSGGRKVFQWNIPNTAGSIEITKGQLELSKADVILDTTSSYPRLNGLIARAICKAAGQELEQECLKFPGNVMRGMVEETNGYNLSCKKVYHYVMPDWSDALGEKTIMNCIDDCLCKMKIGGLHSIAVPSIGTGGMRYNPTLVARGIYRAMSAFGAANKEYKCHVNIVIFPKDERLYNTFVDELQPFVKSSGKGSLPSKTPDVYGDDNIPTKKRDFVLFQFISNDPSVVEETFKQIKKNVEANTKDTSIELHKDNYFDDVELVSKEQNMKFLESLEKTYSVRVTLDQKAKKIKINGLGVSVMRCYEHVLRFIKDLREYSSLKKTGGFVYDNVEWYYTEDGGNIWVPYPSHLTYKLEDAFSQKAQDTDFQDTDDNTYVVDFTSLEEYVKDKRDKSTTVTVMRIDTAEGSKHGFPPNWQPMQNINVEEFPLKPSDPEYKTVEANFKRSLGNYKLSQIKEIHRVQNKTLYQQYQTKKEELETKLNKAPDIERTLWHGTKDDTGKQIKAYGFNRSFAGNTFKQVWYGQGVYFAMESAYSADDVYSPPDNAGWKRMFQAKVLTGQTCQVQKPYQERYAPNLPNSQVDRYDSTCDDQTNPKEFVIYHDAQAYPEYMIIFK